MFPGTERAAEIRWCLDVLVLPGEARVSVREHFWPDHEQCSLTSCSTVHTEALHVAAAGTVRQGLLQACELSVTQYITQQVPKRNTLLRCHTAVARLMSDKSVSSQERLV